MGRGGGGFLGKNLSFQLEVQAEVKADEEASPIVQLFTGVTNITDLVAKFSSSQDSRASSISGAVLPLPPM